MSTKHVHVYNGAHFEDARVNMIRSCTLLYLLHELTPTNLVKFCEMKGIMQF